MSKYAWLWAAIIGPLIVLFGTIVVRYLKVRENARLQKLASKPKVNRIRDPNSSDFFAAMRLYEQRIPSWERDSQEDIARWLIEVEEETKARVCQLEDYFLVCKLGEIVVGFAYLHYYPRASLAFFSYLVIDKSTLEGRDGRVSRELLSTVAQLVFDDHPDAKGIVAEVEAPESLEEAESKHALARIRLFTRTIRYRLKNVKIPYCQPNLSPENIEEPERLLRLLYSIREPEREPRKLTKKEVSEILEFLAENIYGDQFENRADLNRVYRDYLQSWKERILRNVGDVVELD